MSQQSGSKRVNDQTYGFLVPTRKKCKKGQILEEWELERGNLDCGPSESLNTTNLLDLDSMLMMQPSPEEKIKEEVEEPLEKVIKSENDIKEEVKIEIEEDEALLSQNFGSTVISDGELKEIKPETIDEDEFEEMPPLLEKEINPTEEPKVKPTFASLSYANLFPKQKKKCNVCWKPEKHYLVKYGTLPTDRMIVLLGMVIGGILSIPGAICKYTEEKATYICCRHFQESLCFLFDELGVTKAEEICNADKDSIENILEIVESIQDRSMTADQFELSLTIFAEKFCPAGTEEAEAVRLPKKRVLPKIDKSTTVQNKPNSFSPSGRLLKGRHPMNFDENIT